MRTKMLRVGLALPVAFVLSCGGEAPNPNGVSASSAPLTVGGYHCPQTGTIAVSSVPGDNQYYLTTFTGGTMACGGRADGVSLYVADSQRFGCGTHLRVTNPANGMSCVAKVADIGPNICVEEAAKKPVIDASPAIAEALFNHSSDGWSDHALVEATVTSDPLGCGQAPSSSGCQQDSDCNNGQTGSQMVCGNNGQCITGCHSDSDCPSGDTCDTSQATWTCIPKPAPTCNCSGGQICCGTQCVDMTSDSSNCGACNNACPSGETCQNSTCTRPNPVLDGGTTDLDGGNTSIDAGSTCTPCTCADGSCPIDNFGTCSNGSSCAADAGITTGSIDGGSGNTTDGGSGSDLDGGPGPTLDGGTGPTLDGGTTDLDAGTPDLDAGTPDLDAGTPDLDAGIPDLDAGTPDLDAGTPDLDAGTPDLDAGTPDLDAGTPTLDGGTIDLDAGTDPLDGGNSLDAGL